MPKTNYRLHIDLEIEKKLIFDLNPYLPLKHPKPLGLTRGNFFEIGRIANELGITNNLADVPVLPILTLAQRLKDFINNNQFVGLADPVLIPFCEKLVSLSETQAVVYLSAFSKYAFCPPVFSFKVENIKSKHLVFTSLNNYKEGNYLALTYLTNELEIPEKVIEYLSQSPNGSLIFFKVIPNKLVLPKNIKTYHFADFNLEEEAAKSLIPLYKAGVQALFWQIYQGEEEHLEQIKLLADSLDMELEIVSKQFILSLNPDDFINIVQAVPNVDWILRYLSIVFQNYLSLKQEATFVFDS